MNTPSRLELSLLLLRAVNERRALAVDGCRCGCVQALRSARKQLARHDADARARIYREGREARGDPRQLSIYDALGK